MIVDGSDLDLYVSRGVFFWGGGNLKTVFFWGGKTVFFGGVFFFYWSLLDVCFSF